MPKLLDATNKPRTIRNRKRWFPQKTVLQILLPGWAVHPAANYPGRNENTGNKKMEEMKMDVDTINMVVSCLPNLKRWRKVEVAQL